MGDGQPHDVFVTYRHHRLVDELRQPPALVR
jgi:hypothetical protein